MTTKSEHAEFLRGMAVVLGCIIRSYDQPTMAVDIARSNGLDLHHFASAKVEDFDLDPIRKAFHENPECGYCGDTGEVACSSTNYMACPKCSAASRIESKEATNESEGS